MPSPVDHDRRLPSGDDTAGPRATPAPGRTTLTQHLPPRGARPPAAAPSTEGSPPRAPTEDPFGLHLAPSSGRPLPEELRERFEASLGTPLADVRLHTDDASAQAARRLGAVAFATGTDVHFGAGQYDPARARGQHVLAHEVAHVVQQRGAPAVQAKRVSEPGDGLEAEADAAADAMVAGRPTTVAAGRAAATIFRIVDPATAGALVALIDGGDRAALQRIMIALETARAEHGVGAGLTPVRVEATWEGMVDGRDLLELEARTRSRFRALAPTTSPQPAPPAPTPTTTPAPTTPPEPGLRQGSEPMVPLDPGPDYQAMPSYIDNYQSGAYNVLTDVLELVYRDGVVLSVFLQDLHERRAERSAPGAGVQIRMYVYGRDTHGRIRPNVYDELSAPNLTRAMAEIARVRPQVERQVGTTLIDGLPTVMVSWGAGGAIRVRRGGGNRESAPGTAPREPAPGTTPREPTPGATPRETAPIEPAPAPGTSPAPPTAAHPSQPVPPSNNSGALEPQAPAPRSPAQPTEVVPGGPPGGRRSDATTHAGGPDETPADLAGSRPPYGAPPPPGPVRSVTRHGDSTHVRWNNSDGARVEMRVGADEVQVTVINNEDGVFPSAPVMLREALSAVGVPRPTRIRSNLIMVDNPRFQSWLGTRGAEAHVPGPQAHPLLERAARTLGGELVEVIVHGSPMQQFRSITMTLRY